MSENKTQEYVATHKFCLFCGEKEICSWQNFCWDWDIFEISQFIFSSNVTLQPPTTGTGLAQTQSQLTLTMSTLPNPIKYFPNPNFF